MDIDDKINTIKNYAQKLIEQSKKKNLIMTNLINNTDIILDVNFYKNAYDDLKLLSNYQLVSHYVNEGIHEKRLPSLFLFNYMYPNFDVLNYRNNNSDLINLSDIQLMCHYFQHGRYENRKYN
jgi:hypothetical protein